MENLIIYREKINLNDSQRKMIISGWGENAFTGSVVEKITYLSDGLKINGYLAYPADKGKYPCIIWNRGGFGESGVIDIFNARGIYGQMASWGYCVFASHYRGNSGSEGTDEFGGGDVNDVINIIPAAEEVESANTKIWGIEGWSRGGMMTYLSLTRTDIFKAAIISGGIANLRCSAEESRYLQNIVETDPGRNDYDYMRKCEARSVINFPERISRNTALLLIHGTSDEKVPPHDSIDLAQKLLAYDYTFRLILLEKGDHFLKNHRREVDDIRRKWFDKYLK